MTLIILSILISESRISMIQSESIRYFSTILTLLYIKILFEEGSGALNTFFLPYKARAEFCLIFCSSFGQ